MSTATTAGEPPPPVEFGGVNHLALVSSDMARTVDFYQGVLGMPLVKTVELPDGMGQHFFFDCGGSDLLAFFWFSDAPSPIPGVSAPGARPDTGDIASAPSSMNHVAFTVPLEQIEAYREKLLQAGVDCSDVVNHDDSEWGVSEEMHPGVFVRSIYFQDPDGIMLEFAALTTELGGPEHTRHRPVAATGPHT